MNRYQIAREVIKEYAEENELYIYDVVNLKFYESLNQQQAEPCPECGGRRYQRNGAYGLCPECSQYYKPEKEMTTREMLAELEEFDKAVEKHGLTPEQQAEDECACDPEWHEMCQPCRDDEEDK